MNILKVYVSKTGKKLNTDNLTLNQNSYYNTLELYTEEYYSEVVCTFKNSNGDLSPRCHMILKDADKHTNQYKYEFEIPYQLTSFPIPLTSGKLETSFIMYKTDGTKLVYPTVANANILVNKSNNSANLDDSYNGTDVENLWKAVGELILKSAPDGGGKQDILIPGKYIEITNDNIINVLPIDYSYITHKPIIPTRLSELENDTNFSHVSPGVPDDTSSTMPGITINGETYKFGVGDLKLSENVISEAKPVKNIHYDGKDWFVGGITDAEKDEINKQLLLKANKAEVYDIETIDNKLLEKVNYTDIYSKAELKEKFDAKANNSDVYTQTEINDLLKDKANNSDVYTQTVIDGLLNKKVDSTYLTTNYYNQTQINEKLSSALVYKGTVPTYDDLPKSKNKIGDFWNVEADDFNYAWDGKKWDRIGGITSVDLSGYYTSEQIDSKVSTLESNISKKVSNDTFTTYQSEITQKFTDVNNKFNSYYTSITVDNLLSDKANSADVYTISQVDSKLDKKQPIGDYALKTDFKTINNESIIGTGNITVSSGGTTVVANPILDGTEEHLSGLEVEGTKYKVGYENMTFSETAVPGALQLRNISINGDNWGIPEGGQDITVDDTLSTESLNPVQNKVITKKINDVEGTIPSITIDAANSTLNIN